MVTPEMVELRRIQRAYERALKKLDQARSAFLLAERDFKDKREKHDKALAAAEEWGDA